jgi:hypothetical protein
MTFKSKQDVAESVEGRIKRDTTETQSHSVGESITSALSTCPVQEVILTIVMEDKLIAAAGCDKSVFPT